MEDDNVDPFIPSLESTLLLAQNAQIPSRELPIQTSNLGRWSRPFLQTVFASLLLRSSLFFHSTAFAKTRSGSVSSTNQDRSTVSGARSTRQVNPHLISPTPLCAPFRKDRLNDVETLYSTDAAFAAQLRDHRVLTWGNRASGGDSSAVPRKAAQGGEGRFFCERLGPLGMYRDSQRNA